MKKFIAWALIGFLLLVLSPSAGVWYVLISAYLWGSTGMPDSGNTDAADIDEEYSAATPFRDEYGVYEVYTAAGITHYSNGMRSYTDCLGNIHYDNGVVAYDTLRGDKEYIKDREYLGSSYTDVIDTTRYYR